MGRPRINHLLFTDDTMFFCKTNVSSCNELKVILKKYELASGQQINGGKSSVSFSRKAPSELRQRVMVSLGINQEGGVGKYLGLPEHFGRRKKDLFTSIVDRIRQKALSWSNRFLSSAGKLTMLKSVLSTMPTYAMSCFQLPSSLCKRIQSSLTRFWWDSKVDKRGMCWVSWNKMTRVNQEGGLGIRDVQCYNEALLAKLSWRILKAPKSLLARVLLGKYCHSKPFLEVSCPSSTSHGWRNVLLGRDLLIQNLGWAVGNGKSIKAWQEPWLSHSQRLQPMGPAPSSSKELLVHELFLPETVEWDMLKIFTLFPEHVDTIKMLKPSRLGAEDRRIWVLHPSGNYSTKSGYYSARNKTCLNQTRVLPEVNWKAEVLSVVTAPKIKTFLWQCLHGALPTGTQLAARQIVIDTACCKCHDPESMLHVLFTCPFASAVWQQAPFKRRVESTLFQDVRGGLLVVHAQTCLPPVGLGLAQLAPWILWTLWTIRNQQVFNNKIFTIEETLVKAVKDVREWQEAQTGKLQINPLLEPISRFDLPIFPTCGARCKVDAAWRLDLRAAGLGWTFAHEETSLESEHSSLCLNVSSSLTAEGLAMRATVTAATQANVKQLLIESDCLQLIQAINAGILISEIHGIISDILISSLSFELFVCRFIKREANVLADSLAKNSLSLYAQNFD